jgi:tetratricopeptide (TPR) repeat protein
VTLPFVFLLLDFWPLGRLSASLNAGLQDSATDPSPGVPSVPRTRRVIFKLLLEKVPFLAVSVAFAAITVLAQSSGNGVRTLGAFPLWARCANAVVVYATYLEKAVFPHDLVVYYPHPGGQFAWPAVGGAAVLLLAISATTIAGARRWPYLFVGWAWYLGTLVPMIGIVQVGGQQMADRYTYFPLIGLFVAIVWLVSEVVPAGALHSRVLPAAALTSLAALTATAFVQVGYWHDDLSLFEHALDGAKDNAFTRNKIGCALVQRGKLPEAIEQFQLAIRLGPQSVDPQYNLGLVLQNTGRPEEAAEHYRAVLALNNQHANAHNNLGAILLDRGQYQEAKKHFQQAGGLAPNLVEAQINLGAACLRMGDYAEAIAASQRALALDPRLLGCRQNIATALLAQGQLDEAISQLQFILSVDPGDKKARAELAHALAQRHGH